MKNLIQFFKFCIVGASNTVVSYGLNVGVIYLLRNQNVSWDYVAANVIAFVLSVLWSFFWNSRFVFKKKEGQKRRILPALIKMYISYSFTGILLNNILSFIWIDILGISKYIAPLINSAIGVPINFLINKYWAFKDKD